MLTFLKRFAEKKGILIKNSRKFDAVPKGNPGGKKAVYALYNLARDTILPTLPELSDKRSYHILNLLGLPPAQSLYLMDCLHKSMNVAGAVCEMGVAQGATSQLIAQELITTDKRLYLFDSFKGLPAPTKDDSLINDIGGLGDIRRYEGCMCCPQIMVETKLREIDFPTNRTFIISGFFDENTPEKRIYLIKYVLLLLILIFTSRLMMH